MAICKLTGFELAGITMVLPSNQVDNSNLEDFSNFEKEQLILHTGIKYRRVDSPSHTIKDYFISGINKLLNQLSWKTSEIDVLICVTQSKEISIPSFSCKLHGELNFPQQTICFDINSGCSGYVYGLHTAMSLMNSLIKKNVKAILCCGDLSSQLINKKDKSTIPIFSDAISITGIGRSENEIETYYNIETDGSGREAIFIENNFMQLNGIDVFNYSLKLVPSHLKQLFQIAKIEKPEEEVIIFHQANKLINDALVKRLQLNPLKVPSTLYNFGNTASASIPLTLGNYFSDFKIEHAIICGFGVGFSFLVAIFSIIQYIDIITQFYLAVSARGGSAFG